MSLSRPSSLMTLPAVAALAVGALALAPPAAATTPAAVRAVASLPNSAAVATVPTATVTPVLRQGSRGAAVASLQRELNVFRAGQRPAAAAIAVDGVFGPTTGQATRAFQRSENLTVDGVVGPETRTALSLIVRPHPQAPPAMSGPVLRAGDRGVAVRTWQQHLDTFRGRIRQPSAPLIDTDGHFGPVTTAATRDFQRYQHITADGVVGPATMAAYTRATQGG